MPRKKDVIRRGQSIAVKQRLIGGNGLRVFDVFAIAAAEDIGGDHELIATQIWLSSHFAGVDVDQLDYPVGISTAGGGHQVGDGLTTDFDRRSQRVGDKYF